MKIGFFGRRSRHWERTRHYLRNASSACCQPLLICLLHTYYLRPSRTTSFLCMLYATANQVRPGGPGGSEKYLLHYKDLKILNACVGIQNERQPAL